MLCRALRPSGMPSCSSRITWYGPATRVTKYVDSGWVRSNSHWPGSTCSPGALPITTQSAGRGDVQGVRRLEVGLVEAGEDAGRGVHEGHAVDVAAPVGRVDAAVQALAVVAEPHHRVDDQLVAALDRRRAAAARGRAGPGRARGR